MAMIFFFFSDTTSQKIFRCSTHFHRSFWKEGLGVGGSLFAVLLAGVAEQQPTKTCCIKMFLHLFSE